LQAGCQPFFTTAESNDYPIKSGEMKQLSLWLDCGAVFAAGEIQHLRRIEN
jgi:hypothetical protein